MKAPTTLLPRPGRAAAAVGGVVAISATTFMALVAGTATAAEPGRCTENVNVRAEPDLNAPIVALCEAGTAVQVGETRNGFVHLTDLGGWSVQEYVSVNGEPPAAPAAPAPGATPSEPASGEDGSDTESRRGGSGSSGDDSTGPGTDDSADDDDSDSDEGIPRPTQEPARSPLAGLLGG